MQADEVLLVFLRGSIALKRDRLLDFAARPAARGKFLDLLYHQLGEFFDPKCVISSLPDIAWRQPALLFRPPTDFGRTMSSLRSAFDEPGMCELVITADGQFGFWRDETRADSQILVALQAEQRRLTRR